MTSYSEKPSAEAVREVLLWLLGHDSGPYKQPGRRPGNDGVQTQPGRTDQTGGPAHGSRK